MVFFVLELQLAACSHLKRIHKKVIMYVQHSPLQLGSSADCVTAMIVLLFLSLHTLKNATKYDAILPCYMSHY